MHQVQHLPGRLEGKSAGFEVGFEGVEAVLAEPDLEGPSLPGPWEISVDWVGPQHLVHLQEKGYTANMDNIYPRYK